MYEYLKALIIGAIQGLTEFLPVSSSGHIELSKIILGLDFSGDENLLFTLVLHTATALSTVVVFRREIFSIFQGILLGKKEAIQFSLKIIISMMPAAFVGYFFKDTIESLFTGNLVLVGSMLLFTALLLWLSSISRHSRREINLLHAFIIGVSQAIAILPGISRSGATIATSVMLGNDRSKAAGFSFLMVVPLILGAMAKDLLDSESLDFSTEMIGSLSVGFLAAFVFGILACRWMIKLVKEAKLWYFSIYCTLVGGLALVYALL